MSQTLTAIYSNGVLRPLVSLDLPENSEVELDLKVVEKTSNANSKITELFQKRGLSVEKTKVNTSKRLSSNERKQLAEIFSLPHELGDIISEEREEK